MEENDDFGKFDRVVAWIISNPVRFGFMLTLVYVIFSLVFKDGIWFKRLIDGFATGFFVAITTYYLGDYLRRRSDIRDRLRKKIREYRSICPTCKRPMRIGDDIVKEIKEVIEKEYSQASSYWFNNFFNRVSFFTLCGWIVWGVSEFMKNGWNLWGVIIEPLLIAFTLSIIGGYLLERFTRFTYTEFIY